MVLKAPRDDAPAQLSYLPCRHFFSHCTLAILSPLLFLERDPLFLPQGLYVFCALC